jgi:hypothetical protein
MYLRNILVQPGPLSRAPSARSLSCPSFRLIDFGRTEDEKTARAFAIKVDEKARLAKRALGGQEGKDLEKLRDGEWAGDDAFTLKWSRKYSEERSVVQREMKLEPVDV